MASLTKVNSRGQLLLRCSSLRALQLTLAGSGGRPPKNHGSSSARSGSTSFHSGSVPKQWFNETPPGGLTELYIYRPAAPGTVWPDAALGVFGPVDPKYCLPGNVGANPHDGEIQDREALSGEPASAGQQQQLQDLQRIHPDLLTRFTQKEHQAQTLHSATDYIQHTSRQADVCAGMLDSFPELKNSGQLRCELHEAPTLLKKELQGLFPDRDLAAGNLSVITLTQKTTNDMTGWSQGVEEERELLIDQFVSASKEICARLRNEGFWADFVDPTSGIPYFGAHANTTMFETDEKYRMLGFSIEDLGCCKVIRHIEFGTKVFVGSIFTDAHPSSGVVQDMFVDMRMALEDEPTRAKQQVTHKSSD